MFLTIRAKKVALCLLVCVIAVTLGVTVSMVARAAYIEPSNGLTVVLDAGHGGIDGGVVGVNTSTPEAEINLAITKSLKHFLSEKGYNVVLTRKNSDGLYGLFSKSKKLDDMKKRKEIIEEAKPDLMVSIHQNFFPRANQRGAQVFYAPGSEIGEEIANSMQKVLNANLEASKRSPQEGDYYILRCSEYPSILIECGFLSNAEDEKLLLQATYQEKVAYTIFCGIELLLADKNNEVN